MVTVYSRVPFTLTAGTGTAADTQWHSWISASTNATTVTIWDTWVTTLTAADEPGIIYRLGSDASFRQETDEERATRELQQQVAQQRYEQERIERAAAQAEAVERAEQLLRDNLRPFQRRTYDGHGYFDVKAPSGRRYRISKGQRGHGTDVAEVDQRGRTLRRFCTYPRSVEGATWIPEADALLTKKLALEMAEDAFLLVANEYAA